MADQNTKSAMNEMQNMFNPQGYQDIVRTWASYNERMASVFIDAASKSTDITSGNTHEALENLRNVSSVKDDPSEYARAFSEFTQKQMELFVRTAQSLGEVSQRVGSETSDVASSAGQEMGDKAANKAEENAEKSKSAARKSS